MPNTLLLVTIVFGLLFGVSALMRNPAWRPVILALATVIVLGMGVLSMFYLQVESRSQALIAAEDAAVSEANARTQQAMAQSQWTIQQAEPAAESHPLDQPAAEATAGAQSKPFETTIQHVEALDPVAIRLDFALGAAILLALVAVGFVLLLCFPTGRRILAVGAPAVLIALVFLVAFRFYGRQSMVGADAAPGEPRLSTILSGSETKPTPVTSNTFPSNEPRPDWVDGSAKQENSQYYVAVSSELFKEPPDCEASLNEAIAAAARRFLETFGPGSAGDMKIGVADIRARLTKDNYWWETVESPTVGKMLRLHANVSFDITALRQRLREFQVSQRVEYAAIASGATLSVLGLAFVILKRPPGKPTASPAPDLVAGKPPG